MKQLVVFEEVTRKAIVIEGEFMTDIMDKAHACLENPSEMIDFEKNPDYYDVSIKKIKEVIA